MAKKKSNGKSAPTASTRRQREAEDEALFAVEAHPADDDAVFQQLADIGQRLEILGYAVDFRLPETPAPESTPDLELTPEEAYLRAVDRATAAVEDALELRRKVVERIVEQHEAEESAGAESSHPATSAEGPGQ